MGSTDLDLFYHCWAVLKNTLLRTVDLRPLYQDTPPSLNHRYLAMPVPLVRHSEVDVQIIGAGPAGLMCANALACARVNVRIVDQRAFKVTTGYGDGDFTSHY
ncbi:uncharacterized protein EDB93DRAFT_1115965 [Suillus bovinus]|uniref:uncharacterized protein n=1 Tax=Suillus bovinus TaxID=48563 RepID=UPI001B886028|nr:uncharacterized protein EDB93DRAFT_1115965 [Suillus bovinus]KAG2159490.1 hypothetical protein EDB93DRAFT_1115965 [Suillus bovinus]